jgi:hypothetical protein
MEGNKKHSITEYTAPRKPEPNIKECTAPQLQKTELKVSLILCFNLFLSVLILNENII